MGKFTVALCVTVVVLEFGAISLSEEANSSRQKRSTSAPGSCQLTELLLYQLLWRAMQNGGGGLFAQSPLIGKSSVADTANPPAGLQDPISNQIPHQQPFFAPAPSYVTNTYSTVITTTVTKLVSKTLPLLFGVKKITTTIINTETDVITTTKTMTTSSLVAQPTLFPFLPFAAQQQPSPKLPSKQVDEDYDSEEDEEDIKEIERKKRAIEPSVIVNTFYTQMPLQEDASYIESSFVNDKPSNLSPSNHVIDEYPNKPTAVLPTAATKWSDATPAFVIPTEIISEYAGLISTIRNLVQPAATRTVTETVTVTVAPSSCSGSN